jgi:hypothetical protein
MPTLEAPSRPYLVPVSESFPVSCYKLPSQVARHRGLTASALWIVIQFCEGQMILPGSINLKIPARSPLADPQLAAAAISLDGRRALQYDAAAIGNART